MEMTKPLQEGPLSTAADDVGRVKMRMDALRRAREFGSKRSVETAIDALHREIRRCTAPKVQVIMAVGELAYDAAWAAASEDTARPMTESDLAGSW
jgi:hypothetical protein